MLDPVSMSTLFTLMAAFLRERRTTEGEQDIREFRRWLEEAAIPELFRVSDETLIQVRKTATQHGDQLDEILRKIDQIARLLEPSSPDRIWGELGEVERCILRTLFVNELEDSREALTPETIGEKCQCETGQADNSVKYLHEQGWVRRRASTGHVVIGSTTRGLLLTWIGVDPEGFEQFEARLKVKLSGMAPTARARAGQVSEECKAPTPLTMAALKLLAAANLVGLRDGYGDPAAALVHSVSSTYEREAPSIRETLAQLSG